MKKLVILIVLKVCCTCTFAQTDSVNVWNKWCSRKDTLLLFNSGNNVITIHSPTLKATDMKLKSLDPMSLRIAQPDIKGDTVSAIAMPYPAKGKNMRLAILNAKTGKVIKTVNFTSADIPPLVAHVGNIKDNEADRNYILTQQTLRTAFPNSLYSYPYRIKQFTFKITTPKSSAMINVNGFFISKEILQQIKDAPVNTIVEFTNIKATCPECVTRTLDDIKLKIK